MQMENAHALIIGISAYQFIGELPEVVLQDAKDIRNVLIDPKLCGYPQRNVALLTDEFANKFGIIAALKAAAENCTQDSTFFLYASCHGGRVEAGPHSEHYLLPVDGIYSADRVAETAISGEQLTRALRAIPARKIVVILDCCHAGGIGRPKDPNAPIVKPDPTFKTGFAEGFYKRLSGGRGRAILASSRDSEKSVILEGDRNSLFTKYLLAALRGKAQSKDEFIRIFSVFEYIQANVTPQAPGNKQHPIFKADLEDNFPVALRQGGEKPAEVKSAESERPFDAYVNFANSTNDETFVTETLLPSLHKQDVNVAISDDVELLGVQRVVNIDRGVELAKHMVVILSEAFVRDRTAIFQQRAGQGDGILAGVYSIIPVMIEKVDTANLPPSIRALTMLDFTDGKPIEPKLKKLADALKRQPTPIISPPPKR